MAHLLDKATLAALCLAMAFAGVGCGTMKGTDAAPAEATAAEGEPRPLPFENLVTREATKLQDDPIKVDDSYYAMDQEAMGRELELPARQSSREGDGALKMPYPDNLLKGLPDPDASVELKLAFNAADLSDVVAAFAAPEMLNFSYIVDPSVKGAVTLSVDTSMTARDAWETFEHILWLSGAYASMNAGFIHILPFEKMPQERRIFADHAVQPNVIVDFIPIKYRRSADVLAQLRPFMTAGASATDSVDTNTLIIVEAPANIEKLRELVALLDSKGERDWPCRAFQCSEVDADIVATELQSLLPVLGFPVAPATGASGGAVKVVALPRVRCVVVSAAMQEVVNEVGKWVKILDRSDTMDREEIFFYNAEHATVGTLCNALSAFFNAEVTISETSSSSSRSSSLSSSSRSSNSSSNRNRTTGGSSTGTSGTTGTTGTSGTARARTTTSGANRNGEETVNKTVFETPVTVFGDEELNRLTVKTTPRTWVLVKTFLKRHDEPPRQVSIKAIIADITLNNNTEFGVTYAMTKLLHRNRYGVGGAIAGAGSPAILGTATELAEPLRTWSSGDGLGLIFSEGNDPLAVVRAVAGNGNTKILSEPHLVVVSGSQASIQSGEQVAVPTQTTNYTSSSGNMSTNYDYKDIGVLMTVTPYITAGNAVRLTIEQEVTYMKANSYSSTAPDFTKKKVTTEMTLQDASTILLGGMIRNADTLTRTGIPLLKDIPVLGYLFGSTIHRTERTELMVLITVNVIDSENFQDELIRRYKASLEEIASHQSESY